jgi:hypothetical protein
MKRLVYASVVTLLLIVSLSTFPADPPNRPMGVAAEDWVPVGDRLGIVLVPPPAALDDPAAGSQPVIISIPKTALLLPLKPPVGGYFMVRGNKGWVRLVVVEPEAGPANAG